MASEVATGADPSQALDLYASLVRGDGRRLGESATEDQWEDGYAILDLTSATPYHFLTRARGYSKTEDLGAMTIAVMRTQAPPGASLYGLAADRAQGRLLLESMRGFCERTPGLQGAFTFTENRAVTRDNITFEVLAADLAGVWGLRPYFLVCDEVAQWLPTRRVRELFDAATSAVAKVNGRMVLLTTAGRPSHWSYEERGHALADPLWRVHEVSGPAPWTLVERLASEQRRLPASVYARLYDNRWVDDEDRLAVAADLEACAVLAGPLDPQRGNDYVIGVDLASTSDNAVAVVAHGEAIHPDREDTGLRTVVVDRVVVWSGTQHSPISLVALEEELLRLSQRYRGARFVIDKWQALQLGERLKRQGRRVELLQFTTSTTGELAEVLFLLIRNRLLKLPKDPELLRELEQVRLVERVPGVVRMDHDRGGHDDRATALALAARDVIQRSRRGPRVRSVCAQTPPRHFSGLRSS